MGQPIFSPDTVFSFYPPSYQIPGTQTLAPEFGIHNAATALARANFINTVIMQGGATPDPTVTGSTGTTINLTPLCECRRQRGADRAAEPDADARQPAERCEQHHPDAAANAPQRIRPTRSPRRARPVT